MTQFVCDSGPLTHLWQAKIWYLFRSFTQLSTTSSVKNEVEKHVDWDTLEQYTTIVLIATVPAIVHSLSQQFIGLQTTDLEILALAQQENPSLVLTDDLALRRALESNGHTVMGSVGIVLRAYQMGLLNEEQLDEAIDTLFVRTTLYLSPRFKMYVKRLIEKQK